MLEESPYGNNYLRQSREPITKKTVYNMFTVHENHCEVMDMIKKKNVKCSFYYLLAIKTTSDH